MKLLKVYDTDGQRYFINPTLVVYAIPTRIDGSPELHSILSLANGECFTVECSIWEAIEAIEFSAERPAGGEQIQIGEAP